MQGCKIFHAGSIRIHTSKIHQEGHFIVLQLHSESFFTMGRCCESRPSVQLLKGYLLPEHFLSPCPFAPTPCSDTTIDNHPLHVLKIPRLVFRYMATTGALSCLSNFADLHKTPVCELLTRKINHPITQERVYTQFSFSAHSPSGPQCNMQIDHLS